VTVIVRKRFFPARGGEAATTRTPNCVCRRPDPVQLGLVSTFNRPETTSQASTLFNVNCGGKARPLLHDLYRSLRHRFLGIRTIPYLSSDDERPAIRALVSSGEMLRYWKAGTDNESMPPSRPIQTQPGRLPSKLILLFSHQPD